MERSSISRPPYWRRSASDNPLRSPSLQTAIGFAANPNPSPAAESRAHTPRGGQASDGGSTSRTLGSTKTQASLRLRARPRRSQIASLTAQSQTAAQVQRRRALQAGRPTNASASRPAPRRQEATGYIRKFRSG